MENGRSRQVLLKKHDITLNNLKIGECGIIASIAGEREFSSRLLEMGFTPGAVIRVWKIAPMGDPVIIALRAYKLALRRSDAKNILIEEM